MAHFSSRTTSEANADRQRRHFLKRCFGTSCGFAATLLMAPVGARQAYGQEQFGDVVGKRPFGRIEKLAEGVWALVSTPFNTSGKTGDLSTHSNGGIIVGTEKILAIDSYRTQAGCQFMADACFFLTGRHPTHIAHTHFHFDHLGGTRGFLKQADAPEIMMTQTTRRLACQAYLKTYPNPDNLQTKISGIEKWGGNFTDASLIMGDESKPMVLDLGGRNVSIIPLAGHTGSDLAIVDETSQVTFAGDLVWDGIFPNFVSSSPRKWIESVQEITAPPNQTIVPGHGSVCKSDSANLRTYKVLLDEIKAHAVSEFERGATEADAAQRFKLPTSIGDLSYFRSGFHELAMGAWYRQLKLERGGGE